MEITNNVADEKRKEKKSQDIDVVLNGKSARLFITSVENTGKEFCRRFVTQKGTFTRLRIGCGTIEYKA